MPCFRSVKRLLSAYAIVSLSWIPSFSAASELQISWCGSSDATGYFLFFKETEGQPTVWLDEKKIEIRQTTSSEGKRQAWLVDLEDATFLEVVDGENKDEFSLSGVLTGETTDLKCRDVSSAFFRGIQISQPLLADKVSEADNANELAQATIVSLRAVLRDQGAKIDAQSEKEAELREELEASRAMLDEMEILKAKVAALQGFVSTVRDDVVTATDLPDDYVVRFNEHYWNLLKSSGGP